jgi:hypothetical protein
VIKPDVDIVLMAEPGRELAGSWKARIGWLGSDSTG